MDEIIQECPGVCWLTVCTDQAGHSRCRGHSLAVTNILFAQIVIFPGMLRIFSLQALWSDMYPAYLSFAAR